LSKELDLERLKTLLVRIRKAKHLAQTDIASAICTQGMLSKIESGKTSPSFLIVVSLLTHMNISLTEFEDLYLHEMKTTKDNVQQSLDEVIETYQFFVLQKHKQIISFHPDWALFLKWLKFCFNIELNAKLTAKLKNAPRVMSEDLLNQDEFFAADYYPIIYCLPFLSIESALYNYQRLLDQMNRHNIKKIPPFVAIDAAITLGAIFYNVADFTNAYHYFYIAFQKASQHENIPRIIITQIILSLLANDKTFLTQAQTIAELFSKDIFFNYWYNILYSKFNEV